MLSLPLHVRLLVLFHAVQQCKPADCQTTVGAFVVRRQLADVPLPGMFLEELRLEMAQSGAFSYLNS